MKFIRPTYYAGVTWISATLLFVASVAHAQPGGRLENPLNSNFNTIPTFIEGALKVLVIVALPVIALFMVVAGFMFIMARGKPGELEKAKKNFVYVVMGALLILGAWLIAKLLSATVTQLMGP